jgi:hypothetical protein
MSMPKLLRVGSYVEILKALNALNVKEQEVWSLSPIILPTYSLGQTAIFERIESVIELGSSYTANTSLTPKRAQYWTSLQFLNNYTADVVLTLENDDSTTANVKILTGEVWTISNVKIKSLKINTSSSAYRIIGGY